MKFSNEGIEKMAELTNSDIQAIQREFEVMERSFEKVTRIVEMRTGLEWFEHDEGPKSVGVRCLHNLMMSMLVAKQTLILIHQNVPFDDVRH